MIKDINQLDPVFKQKVLQLLEELKKRGIKYLISETKRTLSTQIAYYAQGRKPLIEVNALRQAAGLWLINEQENKKIITWTLQSKHLEGKAIDIVPTKDGVNFWWNAPDEEWKKIAEVAQELELEAGYFWKTKDSPHIQSSD